MNIGIDIGGTKIIGATRSPSGDFVFSPKLPTPPEAESSIETISELVTELLGGQKLTGLAVSCPGPLDFEKGIVLQPPNMPWRDFPLKSKLEAHFKLPVQIEHDAGAAALAEATIGAAQGKNKVLYITISTGIGTGVVLDGQIYHGAHDTEGGHITIDENGPACSCGGHGHFESFVSGRAIEKRFGKPAYDIYDEAIWDDIAGHLAVGITNLAVMLSPDIVVLGGGVSTHYDRFGKLLNTHLGAQTTLYALPPVVPAQFLETAPVLGAILLAEKAAKIHSA